MQSILDILMALMRPTLHEAPAGNSSLDCFYGDPLGFMGERAPRFSRHQLGRSMGDQFSWNWLASIGRKQGPRNDTFTWLSTLVDRRTFSIWAMFEFANFLRDPTNPLNEARLMAAASRDTSEQPELSMNFVKAVWQGFYNATEASMSLLSLGWHDIDEHVYPALVDVGSSNQFKPISSWPRDQANWADFVDANGMRSLRIADDRLRIRQLAALARPSRVYGARNIATDLGRQFTDPQMPALRPLKDGFKGTGRSPSVLAQLLAACGADRVVTSQFLWDASQRVREEQGNIMNDDSDAPGPSFDAIVAHWRERGSDLRDTSAHRTRFRVESNESVCRLKCRIDPTSPLHFVASGGVADWLPAGGRAVPVVITDRSAGEAPPQRGIGYEFASVGPHDVAIQVEAYPDGSSDLASLWGEDVDPLDVDVTCHAVRTLIDGATTMILFVDVCRHRGA